MQLSQKEAFVILSNLEMFIARYELASHKIMTPGAIEIVQKMLTHASFPDGAGSRLLN